MSTQQIVEKINSKVVQPPLKYAVILHNDDYTTMEFVIDVLIRFFSHDENTATQIMMNVHQQGRGTCGIYSAQIAETKVSQVSQYAKQHKYPLLCTMEKLLS